MLRASTDGLNMPLGCYWLPQNPMHEISAIIGSAETMSVIERTWPGLVLTPLTGGLSIVGLDAMTVDAIGCVNSKLLAWIVGEAAKISEHLANHRVTPRRF